MVERRETEDLPEVTQEHDPYAEDGEMGQWLKDIKVGDPKYEALKDRALRGEQQAIVDEYAGGNRGVAIATLGALTVREDDHRDLPGYIEAENELSEIIDKSLMPFHKRVEQRNRGIRAGETDLTKIDKYLHCVIALELKGIRNNIVTPKQQASPPPPQG